MPAFLQDLAACNLVSVSDGVESTTQPWRTAHYSPLLHNTVLYLGMYLLRNEGSEVFAALRKVFNDHCIKLVTLESDNQSISTLRGLNLLAS
jgi:hypothetical protein